MWGGGGGGERDYIPITVATRMTSALSLKVGSDESRFKVSLIVKDNITR